MDSSKGAGSEEVKLARSWTRARVCECLNKEQKFELISFLRDRYEERFFGPIRCLRDAVGNGGGYGFAIMALCCLLIETIQCYEAGVPASMDCYINRDDKNRINAEAPAEGNGYQLPSPWPFNSGSEGAFVNFFMTQEHTRFFPSVGGRDFYFKIRCALLHQAQTENGWRIVRSGSFWDEPEKTINRDEFAERLEECFEDYLSRLEKSEWDEPIWQMARRKIWWLTKLS
jgi:hypothetical protein